MDVVVAVLEHRVGDQQPCDENQQRRAPDDDWPPPRRRWASEMNMAAKGRHAGRGTGAVPLPPLAKFDSVSGRHGNVRLGLFALLDAGPAGADRRARGRPNAGKEELGKDVISDQNRQGSARSGTSDDAGAGASAKPRLVRIGTFDQPLYVTAPPRRPTRACSSSSRPGRIRVIDAGEGQGAAVPRHLRPRPAGGERGLLSVAFHPTTRKSGRFYVDYTDRNGDTRIVEYRRRGDRPRATRVARAMLLASTSRTRTTTAASSRSAPTASCTSAWATAAPAATRRQRAQNLDTLLGKILRIDPTPSGGGRTRVPADNPFVGGARRAPEIWALRPAQPVALLVRPRDRRPVDRRRRPGRRRGDRLRGARPGAGANFGWNCFEGRAAIDAGKPAPDARAPVLDVRPLARRAARSRAATSCATARCRRCAGRYVYGDYCRGQSQLRELRRARDRSPTALGSQVDKLSRSARTPAAASTSRPCRGRCTVSRGSPALARSHTTH